MSRKSPIIALISRHERAEGDKIILSGRCLMKMQGGRQHMDTDKIRIDVPVRKNAAEVYFGSRYGKRMPRGYSLNTYEITVERNVAETLDIQNKLIVNYDDIYEGRILYEMVDLKKGRNRNGRVFIRDGTAVYFRQSRYNSLTLTVRDANLYDTPEGQARIRAAWKKAAAARTKQLAAGLPGRSASADPILMYEKNCSRYEESASVLFEKLIDEGYDNVWYVVNEDNPEIRDLPDKYRSHLVWKDSDRHLELLFRSNTYIATESTEHALQLRVASKLVMDKIRSRDLRYIFLQHGVMYMVSLNSDMRIGFRNTDQDLRRTVVSSEAEARHFIDLAGMSRDELYITGLAKFDRSYRYDTADRIVIMLTWRRWETNQARDDLGNTGYYKMTRRIFEAVPDEYKDEVIILPHPLMADRFRNAEGFGNHVLIADSYDEVLRTCDLLITDYSSIAYDAFYRGSNVIFCWDEKDECMQHYGEGTYLMLNEDNVFGSVCMTPEEITAAVRDRYNTPQLQGDIDRYRHIVEFSDGRNSERIIEQLRRDQII